jgi:hypothetical protein
MKILNATGIVATANLVWTWTNSTTIPGPRTSTSSAPSACANGGSGSSYAYACQHMNMLTDDMLLAARRDGLAEDFLYAVSGANSDSECGICYQMELLKAEKVWRDYWFPQIITQVVNSGFDVLHGSQDISHAAGGFGYYQALSSDCQYNYCDGGPCKEGMYEGDFAAWTDAEFPTKDRCYAGGLKVFNHTDYNELVRKCRRLTGEKDILNNRILWDGCIRSNLVFLHQNFYGSRYTRVQCPESLYRLTGIRRSDDEDYPYPHIDNRLDKSVDGNIESGHPATTTYSDGCRPSCAWPGKVNTVPGYSAVDVCDRQGRVLSTF